MNMKKIFRIAALTLIVLLVFSGFALAAQQSFEYKSLVPWVDAPQGNNRATAGDVPVIDNTPPKETIRTPFGSLSTHPGI
ncbi:MAG: hypothetical protein HC806_04535 [Anaerolineae bacterium]|nr:hypothetical protein [Anaerolineae bacterium]